MSFLRRLSLRRRRSRRRASCPPGIQLTTSEFDGESQPPLDRSTTTATNDNGLANASSRPTTAADAHAAAIDVYEGRIDELGALLSEQGRCLDELTNRSNRLSTENAILRDKVLKERTEKPAPSPRRYPLKSVINQTRKTEEQAQLVRKLKDENSLLHQQADLLAAESAEANKLIAERDASVATLGKELSSCVEKARSLMAEKAALKSDLAQKTRAVETLEANAKRSSALRAEIHSRAEQYLSERRALEAEVADLGTQASTTLALLYSRYAQCSHTVSNPQTNHLSSTVDGLQSQLTSKQGDVEKLSEELRTQQSNLDSAKREAKASAETTLALQETLRRAKQQSQKLEEKLAETRDKLADSQIARHKLETTNNGLQAEVKTLVEQHKAQVSSWSKGQAKLVATIEGQHEEEVLAQQKQVDNLRRLNATLESGSAQCKRDLQSAEQRCSALESLLAGKEREHRDALKELLNRATDAEARVDVGLACNQELKTNVSSQSKLLASIELEKKETDAKHSNVLDELQRKLLAAQEGLRALSTRMPQLEEEAQKVKESCAKDKQKMQEETEHKVREAELECETLRASTKSEKMKRQEAEDLLEKKTRLHQSTLDQLTAEKEDLAAKCSTLVSSEREVGKRLMAKLQELTSRVQTLTAQKQQISHQANTYADKIYELEKVISIGESKLSSFGRQLAASMEAQELRISREVALKRELHSVKIELEKARQSA
ncbi:hypothetical protein ACHAXT_005769 [Thalassiosira profunda]